MLGRWRGALAAGIGIAFYTLLVGPSPSVVRAAIMGGLALFARQVGRRQDGAALNGWIELTTDGEQMWVEVE